MGYKLADGSDSDLYEIGDSFKLDGWGICYLSGDKDEYYPIFYVGGAHTFRPWRYIIPTQATKDRVKEEANRRSALCEG